MHARRSTGRPCYWEILTSAGGVLSFCGLSSLVVHGLSSLCATMLCDSGADLPAIIAASNSWLFRLEFILIDQCCNLERRLLTLSPGSSEVPFALFSCDVTHMYYAVAQHCERRCTGNLYGRSLYWYSQHRGSLGFACFHWEGGGAVEHSTYFVLNSCAQHPVWTRDSRGMEYCKRCLRLLYSKTGRWLEETQTDNNRESERALYWVRWRSLYRKSRASTGLYTADGLRSTRVGVYGCVEIIAVLRRHCNLEPSTGSRGFHVPWNMGLRFSCKYSGPQWWIHLSKKLGLMKHANMV